METTQIRAHLQLLELERFEAQSAGLDRNEAYMRDLHSEISEARAAYLGAAVTEIAIARGELYGRLFG
jgi:hypothetical protein